MTHRHVIDANVVIRYLAQDHQTHSPRAAAFFQQIADEEIEIYLPDGVVFESVYVLNKTLGIKRTEVARGLGQILSLHNVISPSADLFALTFDHWIREPGLSFTDIFIVLEGQAEGIDHLVSFDRKIGRLPGVIRLEPPIGTADQ